MNDAAYLQTQKQLIELAEELARLDLIAFCDRIEVAVSAGPVLNPSLYRLGIDSLVRVQRLAYAAQHLVGVWRMNPANLGVTT